MPEAEGVFRKFGATWAILVGLLRSIFFKAGTGMDGIAVAEVKAMTPPEPDTGVTYVEEAGALVVGADGAAAIILLFIDEDEATSVGLELVTLLLPLPPPLLWLFSFNCSKMLKYLFSDAVVAGALIVREVVLIPVLDELHAAIRTDSILRFVMLF